MGRRGEEFEWVDVLGEIERDWMMARKDNGEERRGMGLISEGKKGFREWKREGKRVRGLQAEGKRENIGAEERQR